MFVMLRMNSEQWEQCFKTNSQASGRQTRLWGRELITNFKGNWPLPHTKLYDRLFLPFFQVLSLPTPKHSVIKNEDQCNLQQGHLGDIRFGVTHFICTLNAQAFNIHRYLFTTGLRTNGLAIFLSKIFPT